ncbi:hypothetical protein B9Z55_027320 [Caenorhabditis nigoni]|uniref:Uncharacterized protein n=1 Tax=Caenorhabditis nigoni TaxID=1611254 RepID=A0A2G5SFW3_9PELO|nr:hypothetical protein B9Z55_027320 [Caenorhabditis nigoni]
MRVELIFLAYGEIVPFFQLLLDRDERVAERVLWWENHSHGALPLTSLALCSSKSIFFSSGIKKSYY